MPQNILIVVDDIDRLEDEQIRTVIRHVKANANFPGLTYLLLYQRDILERAFGGSEQGRQYLEKIVQAAFDVPVVEGERIGRLVLAELEKITKPLPTDGKFDQKRWGNIWVGGLRHFFHNLRDAKRYIGGVEVQFSLQRGSRVLETNFIDTVALETLRLFEPDVYAAIGRSKALLIGRMRERKEAEKEAVKALIAAASSQHKEVVQYVVSQLFPVMGWAFGGSWYDPSDWEETWSSERRICSPRYFDRYFALRVLDGRISDSEFMDFIEHLGDRARVARFFAEYARKNLLPELLERLDQAAVSKNLPLEALDGFLPALFDVAETLPDQTGFSQIPFTSAWRTAAWYLRGEEDIAKRSAALMRAIRSSEALAAPAILISLDMDRDEKGEKDLLIATDLEEAKALWVGKLRTALELDTDVMIRNKHLASFLYRWRDFEGFDGPRAWVASVAARPELLSKLLVAFLQEGQSHTIGDYVSSKLVSLQWEAVAPLIDAPSFTEAVRALSPESGTTEHDARDRYLKAAERHAAIVADAKVKAAESADVECGSEAVQEVELFGEREPDAEE